MSKNGVEKKAKNSSVLIGAAFIMATSAIGPGFLVQTAKFTNDVKANFGFVILVSVLLAMIVQLNVWRVLCVSELRGQDVANRLLPGLGYFVAFLVALGGLVFNIGNVGGGALGFNALLGIPKMAGYFISGGVAIAIFLLKNATKAMDTLTKVLGGCMIIVIFIVILIVKPPIGLAVKDTFLPSESMKNLIPAILTLLGGTVGGYITFSGAHRLIDAKITKEENLDEINRSSIMGIGIATLVRILLFLAVLGVVVKGIALAAENPAADAFRKGAGEIGYRFFGLVLLSAAITSIVGAAYTSVSFLKTFNKNIEKHEKWVIIGFIVISTIIMAIAGNPATLLILAGSLNGLILPVTLGICLIASQKKSIMGESYKHPKVLLILGIIVVVITAYLGVVSLGSLTKLFS
ncbi:NRAMP family divalent metal transporter [Leptotrichia trevisanii]|uniref:Mn2+ and Fe2+ transporters of the NRAMP family n=1 Tax=Leptotrichia trevisanii TaxID=109328 RepID=A0A510K1Z7_9FUSO|nr:NRAMP family divalent metal transporter [Leptotrichia trevisanii]BBM44555.1 Mn2+ and Fe2+ transporters of the NRAMP family [Leptotrichia trevisanii]